jgi:hypothetical protein
MRLRCYPLSLFPRIVEYPPVHKELADGSMQSYCFQLALCSVFETKCEFFDNRIG